MFKCKIGNLTLISLFVLATLYLFGHLLFWIFIFHNLVITQL